MTIWRRANMVERCVHGTYFLIDITQNYFDEKCRLFELNETGRYLWSLLDGCTTEQLSRKLHFAIDGAVSAEDLKQDVTAFILQLSELGFVEVR